MELLASVATSFARGRRPTELRLFAGLLVLFCFALAVGIGAEAKSEIAPCVTGDQHDGKKVYECVEDWLEDFDKEVDFSRLDLDSKSVKDCDDDREEYRTPDGSCNNEDKPWVGTTGEPFGSLKVIAKRGNLTNYDRLRNPNPLAISAAVSAVDLTSPCPNSANALALSWLTWFLNDVYQYDTRNSTNNPIELDGSFVSAVPISGLPLPEGDVLQVPSTKKIKDGRAEFENLRSAYIDSDQLYGSTDSTNRRVREDDGKVALKRGRIDPDAIGDSRALKDYAMAAWQTFWLREHNKVVRDLADHHSMDSDELFLTARMIVNAEITKVHYTEFFPQWVDQPWAIEFAKRDWEDSRYTSSVEYVTITELLPLAYWLQSPRYIPIRDEDGEVLATLNRQEALDHVLSRENGTMQVLMGLASMPAAPLTLREVSGYPRSPVKRDRKACNRCWTVRDQLALAIIRERERGVPRYNDVRRLLRLKPISKFSELTSNKALSRTLQSLYGDVERLDYSVGALAEDRPANLPLPPTMLFISLYSLKKAQGVDRLFGSRLRYPELTEFGRERVLYFRFAEAFRENLDIPRVAPAIFKIWGWESATNNPQKAPEDPCHIKVSDFKTGWYLNLFFITLICTWLFAFGIEVFGRAFWFKFRKMALAHQRAVVSYIIEILYQTAFFSWALYLLIKVVWIEEEVLIQDTLIAQMILVSMMLCALYTWELIYRISLRWQIFAHHLTVIVFTMVFVFRIEHYDQALAQAVAESHLPLGFTAVTEQPVFIALLLYRFDVKRASLFFFSAAQNVIVKLFLHGVALYFYGTALVHWNLFWAIYFPLLELGVLLPAQLYATYAQYVLGMRCLKKAHAKPASGLTGHMFTPPALMTMPSDL